MTEELFRVADRIVEMAGTQAEAEVLVVAGESSLTRFANSFIHQNVGEGFERVSLRLTLDGRVANGSTNRVGDDALRDLVARTAEIARLQPPDPEWPGAAPPAPAVPVEHYDEGIAAATPARRAELVRDFVAQGDDMLAAGYCDIEDATAVFANSPGQRLAGRSSRATIDGIQQTVESAGSAHQTSVRFTDLDGTAAGGLAADRARRGVDATDVEPGEYEVVLGPEAVATIAAFLGFYGFNGKLVAEGQSFVELGASQFDPKIDIWDDGTSPDALGLPFDSEGTPKRRLDLVARGVTSGIAHDRRTAARAATESTGHAIPGSETIGPVPVNLVIGGGATPPEDLVAGVERGLYVSTFNYCRVLDPKSLVVTGLTRNGTFLIREGRMAGGVTNLRFTQSFVAALAPGRVHAVGDDERFADSELGPGLVHVPSLRLAGWNFTGGARG